MMAAAANDDTHKNEPRLTEDQRPTWVITVITRGRRLRRDEDLLIDAIMACKKETFDEKKAGFKCDVTDSLFGTRIDAVEAVCLIKMVLEARDENVCERHADGVCAFTYMGDELTDLEAALVDRQLAAAAADAAATKSRN